MAGPVSWGVVPQPPCLSLPGRGACRAPQTKQGLYRRGSASPCVGLEPSGNPGTGCGPRRPASRRTSWVPQGCCRLMFRPSVPSPSPALKQPGLGQAPSRLSGPSTWSPRPVPRHSWPGLGASARTPKALPASLTSRPGAVSVDGPPGHSTQVWTPSGRCVPPTFPQLRQWCFLRMTVKGALHEVQKPQASSGTHSGGSVTMRVGDTSGKGATQW